MNIVLVDDYLNKRIIRARAPLVTEPIREFLEHDEVMVVWLGSRFVHCG